MAGNEVTGSRPALRTTRPRQNANAGTTQAPQPQTQTRTTRARPSQLRTGFTEQAPRQPRTNTSEVQQSNANQVAGSNRNGYRDLDINQFLTGGSRSQASIVVGTSEGNRTPTGGFRPSYNGHTDPGNRAANRGSFSFQGPRARGLTPQQADEVWQRDLRNAMPAYVTAARRAGLNPNNALLASSYMDLYTQSPRAAGNFLRNLPTLARNGGPTGSNIAELRVRSYDRNGRLHAPGFDNDENRLRADQRRRTAAVMQGLNAQGFRDRTGGSSTTLQTTPPTTQPSTRTTAPNTTSTTAPNTTSTTAPTTTSAEAPTSTRRAASTDTSGTDADGPEYRIRRGDTLSAIAARHGTTVSELARLNNIANPDLIYAGGRLRLPGGSGGATPTGGGTTRPSRTTAPTPPTTEPTTQPTAPTAPRTAPRSRRAAETPLTAPTAPANTNGVALGNGLRVNTNHPTLQRMATGPLRDGAQSSCTRTVRENMTRLGISPLPYSSTGSDPNNPRGALAQTLRSGNWESLPTPGSQLRPIRSPYGNVQANVISAAEFRRMAAAGQIPQGALIFQTRHGWDANVRNSYGNDVAIMRGRTVHNFRTMSRPDIYRDLREVVIVVPRGAIQRN